MQYPITIVINRGFYSHVGLLAEDGNTVIHFNKIHDVIEEVGIDLFINDIDEDNIKFFEHPKATYTPTQVISRARGFIGSDRFYSLFSNNCEHFVNWCLYGKASSEQITQATLIAFLGTLGILAEKNKNPLIAVAALAGVGGLVFSLLKEKTMKKRIQMDKPTLIRLADK